MQGNDIVIYEGKSGERGQAQQAAQQQQPSELMPYSMQLKVDDRVLVHHNDGNEYVAKVTHANPEGTFNVKYLDATDDSNLTADRMKKLQPGPIPLNLSDDKVEVRCPACGSVIGCPPACVIRLGSYRCPSCGAGLNENTILYRMT